MVKKMGRFSDYYYKGYDITSKNRLEKLAMEYQNPYGYNIDSNARRKMDELTSVIKTNQDFIKNKEYMKKNN